MGLQQPRLQVRRHPRLPGQDGLKPQRRGVPRDRLAEPESFRMRGLNCLAHRQLRRRRSARRHPVGSCCVRLLQLLARIRRAAVIAVWAAVARRELPLGQWWPLGGLVAYDAQRAAGYAPGAGDAA